MKLDFNKIIGWLAISVFLITAAPVMAKPDTGHVSVTNSRSGKTLSIPAHAIEVADSVYSLGTATDISTGKNVEGLMFVDKKKGEAKGGKKGKPVGGGDKCYAFLASGAKWKTPENYVVDPENVDGLDGSFVRGVLADATAAWDVEVADTDVFGVEVAGLVNGVDEVRPDGKNEVMFGDIDSPGTVGVTIVWGIFGGRPSNRELVEWDQIYDDVDFDFGDATFDPSVMDFSNVAVHEVGHAAGMGHPSDGCIDETMYRFVSLGETLKRDLNLGDIAGINNLY